MQRSVAPREALLLPFESGLRLCASYCSTSRAIPFNAKSSQMRFVNSVMHDLSIQICAHLTHQSRALQFRQCQGKTRNQRRGAQYDDNKRLLTASLQGFSAHFIARFSSANIDAISPHSSHRSVRNRVAV